MPSISIKTAQNVTIDYELATWADRILAFFLDLLIISLTGLLSFLFLVEVFNSKNISWIITIIFASLYSLTFEILLKGQTIGKKALKIRVINLTGEAIELSSYTLRWSFRLLDIYLSSGILASVLSNTTKKGQRLGDILANTTVIKEKESTPIFLKEIMQLKNKSEVEIKYPNVSIFSEEEMLFAKNTLDRIKKHKNKAHQEALKNLSDKICKKLELTSAPKNKELFIKQVISDYIVSTR